MLTVLFTFSRSDRNWFVQLGLFSSTSLIKDYFFFIDKNNPQRLRKYMICQSQSLRDSVLGQNVSGNEQ